MKRLLWSALLLPGVTQTGCGLMPPPLPPEPMRPVSGSYSALAVAQTTPAASQEVLRLWGNGVASRGSVQVEYLAFSVEATLDPKLGVQGTVFIANSVRGVSFWGAITAGAITYSPNGQRVANLSGILTNRAPFSLSVVDSNATSARDTLTLIAPGSAAPQGLLPFTGSVFNGDIRIVRALQLEVEKIPLGFRFDNLLGLFIGPNDITPVRPALLTPVPERVLQLTPPDPVIDFHRNRPGGLLGHNGNALNNPNVLNVAPYTRPLFDKHAFPNNNELPAGRPAKEGGNSGPGSGSGSGGSGSGGSGSGGSGSGRSGSGSGR